MTAGNGTYSGKDQNLGNAITQKVEFITSRMDQIIAQEAATAGMTADSALVQATGQAGTVKLATLETTGLGNYDKIKGYPVGGAKLTWADYTLQNDRAISVTIDRRDNMGTSGLVSAAAVMAEMMRVEVIPEIDATRMAALYAALNTYNSANQNVKAEAKPTSANLAAKLTAAIDDVSNITGTDEGMTLYINAELKSILDNSAEITLMKDVNNAGTEVTRRIRTFNGIPINYVPSARCNTTVTLNDGFTNVLTDDTNLASIDETKFGFAGGSTPIWFAITTPGVANAVTAINAPKIIPAEQNQRYDGDTFMYRIFHDLIVPKNKCPAAYMSIKSGGGA